MRATVKETKQWYTFSYPPWRRRRQNEGENIGGQARSRTVGTKERRQGNTEFHKKVNGELDDLEYKTILLLPSLTIDDKTGAETLQEDVITRSDFCTLDRHLRFPIE